MRNRVFALALASTVALSGAAAAAQVYVVHGIPGQDVGAPPELPVDICLAEGKLVLAGARFGDIAGPLDLPAGGYDLEVRLSDGACGGALAVANTVYLALGESASIVAHLSEQGVPVLTRFTNDARPLGAGRTRLVVRHGAAVPPVNATVKGPASFDIVKGLESGDQSSALDRRAGRFTVKLYPTSSVHPLLSTEADLDAGQSYFGYAVGSSASGTLALLVQKVAVP